MKLRTKIDNLVGEDFEASNPAMGKIYRKRMIDQLESLFKKEMDKVIGKIIGSLSNDEFWSKENNFQAGIFNRYLDKLRKKANL